jgi:hypothetical protein
MDQVRQKDDDKSLRKVIKEFEALKRDRTRHRRHQPKRVLDPIDRSFVRATLVIKEAEEQDERRC